MCALSIPDSANCTISYVSSAQRVHRHVHEQAHGWIAGEVKRENHSAGTERTGACLVVFDSELKDQNCSRKQRRALAIFRKTASLCSPGSKILRRSRLVRRARPESEESCANLRRRGGKGGGR
eukprot:1883957-Rhodomonas_salina.1